MAAAARAVEHVELDPWCEAQDYLMASALTWIDSTYGSIDAYLDEIGITAVERDAIRNVLTEPVAGV